MRKERARDIKRESKILNVQKRYKYVNNEKFLLKIKYNKEYVHYGARFINYHQTIKKKIIFQKEEQS